MDFVAKGLAKEVCSNYNECHLNGCSKAPKIPDNQAKGWRKVREDVAKAVVAD